MESNSIIFIFFIIIKCLIISSDIINSDFECPRNFPLLVINSENNQCVDEPYNNNIHIISNKIIKIQWLNKMNGIGENYIWYMTSDISSKGDLIIESLIYWEGEPFRERYFYGIKSNGRPFFFVQENNKFIHEIYLQSTSTGAKLNLE